MSAAAFKAAYADWKVIKGRKVVQIVFELPLESADQAYRVLGGMPIAANEIWCGIARITNGGTQNSAAEQNPPQPAKENLAGADKPKRKFHELPYSQQAAMRCDDPIYRAFLREMCGKNASDADAAAEDIRDLCGVESRRDIRPDTEAEKSWLELEQWFAAWQVKERAMA